MFSEALDAYRKTLTDPEIQSIPALMDEKTALRILSDISGEPYASITDIAE